MKEVFNLSNLIQNLFNLDIRDNVQSNKLLKFDVLESKFTNALSA